MTEQAFVLQLADAYILFVRLRAGYIFQRSRIFRLQRVNFEVGVENEHKSCISIKYYVLTKCYNFIG